MNKLKLELKLKYLTKVRIFWDDVTLWAETFGNDAAERARKLIEKECDVLREMLDEDYDTDHLEFLRVRLGCLKIRTKEL